MVRCFFCFLFFFNLLFSQNLAESFSNICSNHGIVGGTLITYSFGDYTISNYGLSEINKSKKIDDNTQFKVASISKMIVAIAIMKLYEEGLLDVDDNINKYLGFEIINPYYESIPITIKMLLNHTSTLVDSDSYLNFINKTHLKKKKPIMSSYLQNNIDHDFTLNKTPGNFFSYSNINYGLLGVIIEQVTKKRFDKYLDEILFKPLGITGGFNINKIKFNNLSVLYRWGVPQKDFYLKQPNINLDSYLLGEHTLLFSPHSGCRISAKDLIKVVELFLNNGLYFDGDKEVKILNKSTLDLMLNSSWKFDGLNGNNFFNLFNEWALGLQITQNEECSDVIFSDDNLHGHIGRAYGLLANLFFSKKNNNGFIVIVNGYYDHDYEEGIHSSFSKFEEDVFKLIEKYFSYKPNYYINFFGQKTNHFYPNSLVFFKESNFFKKFCLLSNKVIF